jgi:hypothetical protein
MYAMLNETSFSPANLDYCLLALAKEYKRLSHAKEPVEIVIIGGASIALSYAFRQSTQDIDAFIFADSCMKEAIRHVADELHLPADWLNDDFRKTTSFSVHIPLYSHYYKTFGHILIVRRMEREYLLAMKLASFRLYKRDRSDIVGILMEEKENGRPIALEEVQTAVKNLYGGWANLPRGAEDFLRAVMANQDYRVLYEKSQHEEDANHTLLQKAAKEDPGKLRQKTLEEVLRLLKEKGK